MSIQYLNSHMHTEHMLDIGNVTSAASGSLKVTALSRPLAPMENKDIKTPARKQGQIPTVLQLVLEPVGPLVPNPFSTSTKEKD